jgi:hypothetical protein
MLDTGIPRRLERRWARPAVLLAAAAVLCVATALLLLSRRRVLAGVAALLAAVALLLGSLARTESPRRSRFAEGVLDRGFDASVLAPLAWDLRAGAVRVAVLALVALGASFLASYERARGQSLGYRGTESIAYRAVKGLMLPLALLTGWIEGFLWAFVVLATAAAAVRAYNVARQDREARLRPEGAE